MVRGYEPGRIDHEFDPRLGSFFVLYEKRSRDYQRITSSYIHTHLYMCMIEVITQHKVKLDFALLHLQLGSMMFVCVRVCWLLAGSNAPSFCVDLGLSGCCNDTTSCAVRDDRCFCDQGCHSSDRNDCCPDIEEIGCFPPSTAIDTIHTRSIIHTYINLNNFIIPVTVKYVIIAKYGSTS